MHTFLQAQVNQDTKANLGFKIPLITKALILGTSCLYKETVKRVMCYYYDIKI